MYLRNSTLLPVAWKLSGMENLGDDFSVTVSHGIIEPLNEFGLQMHFRAVKATNIKKIVRLEVRVISRNLFNICYRCCLSLTASSMVCFSYSYSEILL